MKRFPIVLAGLLLASPAFAQPHPQMQLDVVSIDASHFQVVGTVYLPNCFASTYTMNWGDGSIGLFENGTNCEYEPFPVSHIYTGDMNSNFAPVLSVGSLYVRNPQ